MHPYQAFIWMDPDSKILWETKKKSQFFIQDLVQTFLLLETESRVLKSSLQKSFYLAKMSQKKLGRTHDPDSKDLSGPSNSDFGHCSHYSQAD